MGTSLGGYLAGLGRREGKGRREGRVRACQGASGQLLTHLLTFLGICSLLDLGGGGVGSDLGQEGEEAEEQAGPPERHAAAGWAAAACVGLGHRALQLGPSGES